MIRLALLWHSLGFAILIILLWADELFSFLYRYFGGDWRQVDVSDAAVRLHWRAGVARSQAPARFPCPLPWW